MSAREWAWGRCDTIAIEGIRAYGTHGVLPAEHVEPQLFLVDVRLDVDTQSACISDELADTVSYADVAAQVVAIIEGEHVDLIERLAGMIAQAALAHALVEQVQVRVHKPNAPVGVPFGDVSVTVSRSDIRPAVVALGANLADPLAALSRAASELANLPRTRVAALSPVVETDPVGGPEQPAYLNAVALLETTLRPARLLALLHDIEARAGRERNVRWGPRTLDLDLIQYGDPATDTDVTSADTALSLPHPRAHERGFVLVPWAQVAPNAVLRTGQHVTPVRALADALAPAQLAGVRVGPPWPVRPC